MNARMGFRGVHCAREKGQVFWELWVGGSIVDEGMGMALCYAIRLCHEQKYNKKVGGLDLVGFGLYLFSFMSGFF